MCGKLSNSCRQSLDKNTIDYTELLLDCLKTKPSSRQEIISLDQKVLNLRVASALDAKIGQNLPEPIVHGTYRSKIMMA